MADENNENLSMEDILSSIKDILTEDEQKQSPEPAYVQPFMAATHTVEQPVEDILDLSPSMRIEEELDSSVPEINLENELDNILPDFDSLTLPEETLATEVVDESIFSTENILKDFPAFDDDKNLDSDPFDTSTPENTPAFEANPFNIEAETPVVDNWSWDDVSEETETTTLVGDEEQVSTYEPETLYAPEAEVQPEPEPFVEFEPEPEPVFEAPVNEAPVENAVDVSASIINNFAKMFSHDGGMVTEREENVIELPTEPITELGHAAQTIEDVVATVIRSIIGDEVAANWRNGADYDTLAREEIKAQTKIWLDKNLPSLVEKIVKSEIQRVMAKVGS